MTDHHDDRRCGLLPALALISIGVGIGFFYRTVLDLIGGMM